MDDLLDQLLRADTSVFQSTETRRKELATDLTAASFTYGQFAMTDGRSSEYFVDRYLFLTKPTILRRLATVMAPEVRPEVDRLVGTEPGSIALAVALSLETGIPFVVVDTATESGDLAIRGELHAGESVVLVEDVVSSGIHALQACEALAAMGAVATTVLCVIDREEGASERLGEAGIRLEPLFTVGRLAGGRRTTTGVGTDA